MSPFTQTKSPQQPAELPGGRRSLAALLEPLDRLAGNSVNLIAKRDLRFEIDGEWRELPRYLFIGPQGGDQPIRLGLFAGVHGDEPEGPQALVQFARLLERCPELAQGYCLFLYPVCNPTGYEDNTRCSRRGRDLNREFWNHSNEPEVRLLESELCAHAFDGLIALHSDDTSPGLYGFARGATMTRHLLEPALAAAESVLPRNREAVIDGFAASEGIIRHGYDGVLGVPPQLSPRPFEIVFETPQKAPHALQVQALVLALQTILVEYRKFIAYAPNL